MPDITTPEGRDAVEERIMRAMGAVGVVADDDWDRHVGWALDIDDEPKCVPMGWLYTGDGMVEVKRWFAQQRGIIVSSQPATMQHGDAFAEVVWTDEDGSDKVWAEAADEPTAVALALYRALEEVGG